MKTLRPTAMVLGLVVSGGALLLAGCKSEETRPAYEQSENQRRIQAVEQADRQRQEAQAQAQAQRDADARAAAGDQPPAAPPPSAASSPQPPAAYLPPSEDGAEVQMTETPLEGTRPAASAGAAATSQTPGTGGRVPTGGATAGAQTTAAAPPPGGAMGQRTPAGAVESGLTATAPRTNAEQAAALDQDLQRKLREFDALMRQAQQNAARDRAAAEAGGAGSPDSEAAGGQGGLLETPPDGLGAGGSASRATGLGNTPDQSGETRAGARPVRRGATEVALPAGGDDDIVARQLREAAERETDPVLRDKLWAEYRNYKGGL